MFNNNKFCFCKFQMTEKDISLKKLVETKKFELVRDYKELLKDVATKKEIDKLVLNRIFLILPTRVTI